ncbi:MAG: hypothetical protein MAG451_00326 [Anaerolineales bacterium]|nr:hypothetical protein [Anaerolineales bacterium]
MIDGNREVSHEFTLVAGITLLAALFRFLLLGQLPPGLYHDEAINGLDALRVLDGATPVFFTANNGREPLFIYLIAGSVALLGRSALAIRIVPAVLGTLTVPATYLLSRRLFNRRIGLLTATIAAITVWSINLSRVGFRAVAMPLFVALTVWAFWRGYEQRIRRDRTAWRWFALAGAFAGIMLYTYLAARFAPLAFLGFIGYLLLRRRLHTSQFTIHDSRLVVPWSGFLLFACVAIIVAGPLLGYFLTHRTEAARRAFQVSILNPEISGGDPLGTLLDHAGRTLLMFNVRGDFIPRHNVPLRPVFDPLLSIFFLLGLGVAIRQWREPAYGFILIWTSFMLLPTVLAEDAPHFLRAVGILPVVFIIPALGLSVAIHWLKRTQSLAVAGSTLLIALSLSLGLTTYDYFVRHARSENTYYQFETGATELASDVNTFLRQHRNSQAYVDHVLWGGWAAIRFLIPHSQRVTVLTDDTPRVPASPQTVVALWPFQDLSSYFSLLPENSTISVREGAQESGDLESEARLLYVLFQAVPHSDAGRPLAIFGDDIALQEAGVEPVADGRLQVRFVLECREPLETSYAITAQLLTSAGLITQEDGPPARGFYPTTAWRAGDRIIESRTLELPVPYDPARHSVIIAIYDPDTMQRLPVAAPDGASLGDRYTYD